MKVVVLISGRGSNLHALLDHQQGYKIIHVVSNNKQAKGLQIAQSYGVINSYINWSNRGAAETYLKDILHNLEFDLLVLAGFMRILSAEFVAQFENKIINIHPSLLPKYPGLNTHKKVLANQDKYHGATVHLVDDKLDHGLILGQTQILVDSTWDEFELAAALLAKEHELLTTVISQIATDQMKWHNGKVTIYQQQNK